MRFDRCRVFCIHPRFSQIIAVEVGITLRIRTTRCRGQGRRADLSHAVRAHARSGRGFGDVCPQGLPAADRLGAFRDIGTVFLPRGLSPTQCMQIFCRLGRRLRDSKERKRQSRPQIRADPFRPRRRPPRMRQRRPRQPTARAGLQATSNKIDA